MGNGQHPAGGTELMRDNKPCSGANGWQHRKDLQRHGARRQWQRGRTPMARMMEIAYRGFCVRFALTDHALARSQQRGIREGAVRATIRRVAHLLKSVAERNAKVVIPSYSNGCALVVQFKGCKATILTVLRYPEMALPSGTEVLDWRAGLA